MEPSSAGNIPAWALRVAGDLQGQLWAAEHTPVVDQQRQACSAGAVGIGGTRGSTSAGGAGCRSGFMCDIPYVAPLEASVLLEDLQRLKLHPLPASMISNATPIVDSSEQRQPQPQRSATAGSGGGAGGNNKKRSSKYKKHQQAAGGGGGGATVAAEPAVGGSSGSGSGWHKIAVPSSMAATAAGGTTAMVVMQDAPPPTLPLDGVLGAHLSQDNDTTSGAAATRDVPFEVASHFLTIATPQQIDGIVGTTAAGGAAAARVDFMAVKSGGAGGGGTVVEEVVSALIAAFTATSATASTTCSVRYVVFDDFLPALMYGRPAVALEAGLALLAATAVIRHYTAGVCDVSSLFSPPPQHQHQAAAAPAPSSSAAASFGVRVLLSTGFVVDAVSAVDAVRVHLDAALNVPCGYLDDLLSMPSSGSHPQQQQPQGEDRGGTCTTCTSSGSAAAAAAASIESRIEVLSSSTSSDGGSGGGGDDAADAPAAGGSSSSYTVDTAIAAAVVDLHNQFLREDDDDDYDGGEQQVTEEEDESFTGQRKGGKETRAKAENLNTIVVVVPAAVSASASASASAVGMSAGALGNGHGWALESEEERIVRATADQYTAVPLRLFRGAHPFNASARGTAASLVAKSEQEEKEEGGQQQQEQQQDQDGDEHEGVAPAIVFVSSDVVLRQPLHSWLPPTSTSSTSTSTSRRRVVAVLHCGLQPAAAGSNGTGPSAGAPQQQQHNFIFTPTSALINTFAKVEFEQKKAEEAEQAVKKEQQDQLPSADDVFFGATKNSAPNKMIEDDDDAVGATADEMILMVPMLPPACHRPRYGLELPLASSSTSSSSVAASIATSDVLGVAEAILRMCRALRHRTISDSLRLNYSMVCVGGSGGSAAPVAHRLLHEALQLLAHSGAMTVGTPADGISTNMGGMLVETQLTPLGVLFTEKVVVATAPTSRNIVGLLELKLLVTAATLRGDEQSAIAAAAALSAARTCPPPWWWSPRGQQSGATCTTDHRRKLKEAMERAAATLREFCARNGLELERETADTSHMDGVQAQQQAALLSSRQAQQQQQQQRNPLSRDAPLRLAVVGSLNPLFAIANCLLRDDQDHHHTSSSQWQEDMDVSSGSCVGRVDVILACAGGVRRTIAAGDASAASVSASAAGAGAAVGRGWADAAPMTKLNSEAMTEHDARTESSGKKTKASATVGTAAVIEDDTHAARRRRRAAEKKTAKSGGPTAGGDSNATTATATVAALAYPPADELCELVVSSTIPPKGKPRNNNQKGSHDDDDDDDDNVYGGANDAAQQRPLMVMQVPLGLSDAILAVRLALQTSVRNACILLLASPSATGESDHHQTGKIPRLPASVMESTVVTSLQRDRDVELNAMSGGTAFFGLWLDSFLADLRPSSSATAAAGGSGDGAQLLSAKCPSLLHLCVHKAFREDAPSATKRPRTEEGDASGAAGEIDRLFGAVGGGGGGGGGGENPRRPGPNEEKLIREVVAMVHKQRTVKKKGAPSASAIKSSAKDAVRESLEPKLAANKKFSFLRPEHPHHDFYLYCLAH